MDTMGTRISAKGAITHKKHKEIKQQLIMAQAITHVWVEVAVEEVVPQFLVAPLEFCCVSSTPRVGPPLTWPHLAYSSSGGGGDGNLHGSNHGGGKGTGFRGKSGKAGSSGRSSGFGKGGQQHRQNNVSKGDHSRGDRMMSGRKGGGAGGKGHDRGGFTHINRVLMTILTAFDGAISTIIRVLSVCGWSTPLIAGL